MKRILFGKKLAEKFFKSNIEKKALDKIFKLRKFAYNVIEDRILNFS